MSAQLVREAWGRIEVWCRANDPQSLRALNGGASETEIASLEAAIGQRLPEDLLVSLSIHNGQSTTSHCQFMLGGLRLSACEEIAREHSEWRGSAGRDAPDYWRFFPENAIARQHFHERWIPVIDEEGCGNGIAVDLAPGPAGTIGQVIDFGRDIRNPGVMASSWGEFLNSYADMLDILTEASDDLEDLSDAFYRMRNLNCLDSLVRWARDGRWPIVRFDPAWRTSAVMSLAKRVSKTRDFSVMPILADALQDAGCENAAVLNHCRDSECTHAKGCWVIDTLVSGIVKEERWCHDF